MGAYSAPFLRKLGIYLNIYPAKGYSITVPTTSASEAPRVSLTDDQYKLVYSRLGERLRVAGTAEFSKIAFGPIGPQSYPVFYGMGFVDGEWASWMSPNINVASPTWIKIGFYPYDNVADARCMEGNKDSLGVVYVGLSGSGAAYGDFSALIQ